MPDRPAAADERPDLDRAARLAALRRLDAICDRHLAALAVREAAEAPAPGVVSPGAGEPPPAE